jgi:hypothetical protein
MIIVITKDKDIYIASSGIGFCIQENSIEKLFDNLKKIFIDLDEKTLNEILENNY